MPITTISRLDQTAAWSSTAQQEHGFFMLLDPLEEGHAAPSPHDPEISGSRGSVSTIESCDPMTIAGFRRKDRTDVDPKNA